MYLCSVRIISKRTLREFWEKHADSEQQILSWYKDFQNGNYSSSKDVLNNYSACRSIGLNRYVFKIKGNNYRLIIKINFELKTAWIRFIGTHSEYDKIDTLKI